MQPLPRRDFLTSATLAAAALAAAPALGQSAPSAKARLTVGLIGCGGRGNGALADFIAAAKLLGRDVTVTAVGDAFGPSAQGTAKRFGVDAAGAFSGYDAYRKVIASGCDFVVMAAPPAFRPVHFAAAVEAGKHCFIEKPVAVDAVGARAMRLAGETAKARGLGVVAGTQRRHQAAYLLNKARIDAGAIGEIRGGTLHWNSTVPWIKRRNAGESAADYLARNWLNFAEMSGDHIVEQHVHNLDVAIWFLGRPPVSAVGYGGRARRETGNMFDFFSVDYDFGGGVHIHSQCRQISGTWSRVGELFTGATGEAFGAGKVTGRKVDVPEPRLESDNPYVQEHVALIKGVLAGNPPNETRAVTDSTLAAIMGRLSAYTGELVRWADLVDNEKSPWHGQACRPSAADFEKGEVTLPEEKPPVPGKA
jgi:myo-inositol 2-dehydrogenase/D-chiro-inositol 1-dehydrogenase